MQQTITTTAIRMTATEIPATAPVERPPADLVPVHAWVCVYTLTWGRGNVFQNSENTTTKTCQLMFAP